MTFFFHIGSLSKEIVDYSSRCHTSECTKITRDCWLIIQIPDSQPGELNFTVLLLLLLMIWGKGGDCHQSICLISTQVDSDIDS